MTPDDWRGIGHVAYGKIARYYPCVIAHGKIERVCDSRVRALTYIGNSPELTDAFVARVPFRALPVRIQRSLEERVRRERENDWW